MSRRSRGTGADDVTKEKNVEGQMGVDEVPHLGDVHIRTSEGDIQQRGTLLVRPRVHHLREIQGG